MLKHRNLTKGGYAASGTGEGYGSIEGSYSGSSSSSSSSSYFHKESSSGSGSRKQEAVQMWPQEVNLKLRISRLLIFVKMLAKLCTTYGE